MNLLEACESLRWVREEPDRSNSTPLGRQYGMDRVAWCGIAVWAGYLKAGMDLRVVLTQQMQSTVAIQSAAKRKGWFVAARSLRPGYIVLFHMPGGRKGVNHTGVVKEVTPSGCWCYEGNTSGAGSQFDGGAYMLKFRPWSLILGGVRVPGVERLMAGSTPPPVVPLPPGTQPFAPVARTGVFKGNTSVLVACLQYELSAICGPQGDAAAQAEWDAEGRSQTYANGTQWRVHAFLNFLELGGNTRFRGHSDLLVSPDLFQAIDFTYWLHTKHLPIVPN